MQSEPTAVSQHPPLVDSSQSSPKPTQHGHDSEDGAVSGLLRREDAGDSDAPRSSTPGTDSPPLSAVGVVAPPSLAHRVSQHETARTPGKKSSEPSFQVLASEGQSKRPLETLPNGMFCSENSVDEMTPLTTPCRGSYTHLVAPTSAVALDHYLGISPLPYFGHHAPCLENCLFAVLPGSSGS